MDSRLPSLRTGRKGGWSAGLVAERGLEGSWEGCCFGGRVLDLRHLPPYLHIPDRRSRSLPRSHLWIPTFQRWRPRGRFANTSPGRTRPASPQLGSSYRAEPSPTISSLNSKAVYRSLSPPSSLSSPSPSPSSSKTSPSSSSFPRTNLSTSLSSLGEALVDFLVLERFSVYNLFPKTRRVSQLSQFQGNV
ncbi:hypothetical protein BDY24DRAFT_387784, partial [Mrakia frigida]|uniref:uncharacterized protein n=1 Tax=Mrakia frigida TaxID=29902 RepID=UPI003FCC1B28